MLRGEASGAVLHQLWPRVCGVAVAVSCALLMGADASTGHVAATVSSTGDQQALALASALSARQLAGQRVIYSYSGRTPPASLLQLIRLGDVGGVIFFGSNFRNKAQFTAAVGQLETANASTSNPARKYPLLLMTDQEGGEVRRLPGAPVRSEKWIGSRPTPAARAFQARSAGKAAGENLLSFGLNVNLAPVLDVYRAAGDFDDQFQRSYSMNPSVVSTLGADFIRAQQATGVVATAKHFPGLGAATASQNTDDRPVAIRLPAKALRSVDEYPYQAAIAAGVKLVMVSWARYPALGSGLPAGLSSVIVKGQLRQRLGFTGVTITDAIGAGALTAFGSPSNRALKAAQAGMQLILSAAQTPTEGQQCLAGLLSGFRSGALSKSAFRATVAQILRLRASLPA
ncbi:MAG TPA: glycoside hydrolase family 3 N-terminal domain-containing protein [Streptosporangiaceae bacterium]|nr:glycoside hydrolase family 3 N-terminal domain-containing protein [Streptosporangiaceae bacterium]